MAEEMQQGSDYVEDEVENDVEPKAKLDVKMAALIGVVIVVVVIIGLLYTKSQGRLGDTSEETTSDSPEWFSDEETVTEEEGEEGEGDSYYSEDWYGEEEEGTTTEPSYIDDTATLELRALGYTGDEIEYYSANGMDYDAMVDLAEDQQKAKQQEIIDEVNTKSTGLYKKLLDMTWMGGKDAIVQKVKSESDITIATYIENVDYVKCDAKGRQLFIRCTLDSGEHVFMTLSPKRWRELKKKGNIVIEYTVEEYKDTRIITSIEEVVQSLDDYDSDWE